MQCSGSVYEWQQNCWFQIDDKKVMEGGEKTKNITKHCQTALRKKKKRTAKRTALYKVLQLALYNFAHGL